jgi:hypothetical protein
MAFAMPLVRSSPRSAATVKRLASAGSFDKEDPKKGWSQSAAGDVVSDPFNGPFLLMEFLDPFRS